jgi:hypothetical protein
LPRSSPPPGQVPRYITPIHHDHRLPAPLLPEDSGRMRCVPRLLRGHKTALARIAFHDNFDQGAKYPFITFFPSFRLHSFSPSANWFLNTPLPSRRVKAALEDGSLKIIAAQSVTRSIKLKRPRASVPSQTAISTRSQKFPLALLLRLLLGQAVGMEPS